MINHSLYCLHSARCTSGMPHTRRSMVMQANCSEHQVRQYLANLRSNLRSFIQRAQRNAAGKVGSVSNGAAAASAPAQRSLTGELAPPLMHVVHVKTCACSCLVAICKLASCLVVFSKSAVHWQRLPIGLARSCTCAHDSVLISAYMLCLQKNVHMLSILPAAQLAKHESSCA